MNLRRELALFAVGGVLGFIVDAGIVHLLVRNARWNPYVARVLSFMVAASVTWWWNRNVTFAHRRGRRTGAEWGRWMAVMAGGALLNYAIYALLVWQLPLAHAWPVIAVAAGSGIAAGANFIGARALVFSGPEKIS